MWSTNSQQLGIIWRNQGGLDETVVPPGKEVIDSNNTKVWMKLGLDPSWVESIPSCTAKALMWLTNGAVPFLDGSFSTAILIRSFASCMLKSLVLAVGKPDKARALVCNNEDVTCWAMGEKPAQSYPIVLTGIEEEEGVLDVWYLDNSALFESDQISKWHDLNGAIKPKRVSSVGQLASLIWEAAKTFNEDKWFGTAEGAKDDRRAAESPVIKSTFVSNMRNQKQDRYLKKYKLS
ncbi:hypothetical protein BC830DRAFT_1083051 [Chytriomyces sp. MP71]|nr:hypothetical protein BC830DRAFT_1083051 [Chytriomyces sp. MP71]